MRKCPPSENWGASLPGWNILVSSEVWMSRTLSSPLTFVYKFVFSLLFAVVFACCVVTCVKLVDNPLALPAALLGAVLFFGAFIHLASLKKVVLRDGCLVVSNFVRSRRFRCRRLLQYEEARFSITIRSGYVSAWMAAGPRRSFSCHPCCSSSSVYIHLSKNWKAQCCLNKTRSKTCPRVTANQSLDQSRRSGRN